MNRLERVELYDRVKTAEAKVAELSAKLDEALSRIDTLENKPRIGRPPKAKDGEGLHQSS